MLHYYFGDNIFTSRQKLFLAIDRVKVKEGNSRLIKIDGRNFEKINYQQLFSGQTLFSERLIILIEKLSSFPKQKKKEIIQLLLSLEKAEIFIWENKEIALPATIQKHPAGVNLFRFPKPKIIFRLSEAIYPGNQKVFLPMLAEILQSQPVELVYFFLKKHLHLLFLFLVNPKAKTLVNLPDWRKRKLESQIQRFPNQTFFPFYKNFVELDYLNKSGKLQEGLNLALVNLLSSL